MQSSSCPAAPQRISSSPTWPSLLLGSALADILIVRRPAAPQHLPPQHPLPQHLSPRPCPRQQVAWTAAVGLAVRPTDEQVARPPRSGPASAVWPTDEQVAGPPRSGTAPAVSSWHVALQEADTAAGCTVPLSEPPSVVVLPLTSDGGGGISRLELLRPPRLTLPPDDTASSPPVSGLALGLARCSSSTAVGIHVVAACSLYPPKGFINTSSAFASFMAAAAATGHHDDLLPLLPPEPDGGPIIGTVAGHHDDLLSGGTGLPGGWPLDDGPIARSVPHPQLLPLHQPPYQQQQQQQPQQQQQQWQQQWQPKHRRICQEEQVELLPDVTEVQPAAPAVLPPTQAVQPAATAVRPSTQAVQPAATAVRQAAAMAAIQQPPAAAAAAVLKRSGRHFPLEAASAVGGEVFSSAALSKQSSLGSSSGSNCCATAARCGC